MMRFPRNPLALLIVLWLINVSRPADAQPPYPGDVAFWRDTLANDDGWLSRSRAAYVLGRMSSDDPDQSIAALTAALEDEDPVVKWYAADSLARFGYAEAEAVDKLLVALNNTRSHVEVRRSMARALGQIGDRDERVIKALRKTLEDEQPLLAIESAEALLWLEATEPALQKLTEWTKHKQPTVAFAALRALERLRERHSPPTDLLIELLGNPASDVRRLAARLLGRGGWSVADPVLDALEAKKVTPDNAFAALRYVAARETDSSQAGVAQARVLETAWRQLFMEQTPATARVVLLLNANASLETLLAHWTDWNAASQDRALTMIDELFRRRRGQLDNASRWSQSKQTIERLLTLLEREEAKTRRLALWMLAELPLRPSREQLVARRAQIELGLRDNDVFNRRNAAAVLRRLDAPTDNSQD